MKEIQEVRLAKAELALADGNYERALRFVKRNMIAKHFHLESFLFLIELFKHKESLAKAMKVYYYLIKRFHSEDIITQRSSWMTASFLDSLSPPNKQALGIYFAVAAAYYEAYEKGVYKDGFSKRLLALSQKYFLVCAHYNYSLAEVKYYMALLKRAAQKHGEAIDFLIEAEELFAKRGEDQDSTDQVQTIQYLLGDSLVRSGHLDAGIIHLKSIYLSPTTNSSLKEYANSYLNSLPTDIYSLSASFGVVQDNNINNLTDEQRDRFESDYQYYYISENASKQTRNVSFYHSNILTKYWTKSYSLNYNEQLVFDQQLRLSDYRGLGAGFDLKYSNLIKSQAEFSYYYTQAFARPTAPEDYDTSSRVHSFEVRYLHTLKRGTVSYRLPISYAIEDDTSSLGFYMSYSSFTNSKYLTPTYSLGAKRVGEENATGDSLQLDASFNNSISFSSRSSAYLSLNYLRNRNSDLDYDYSEYSANLYLNYLFEFVSHLSGYISASKKMTDQTDGKINRWTMGAGISCYF